MSFLLGQERSVRRLSMPAHSSQAPLSMRKYRFQAHVYNLARPSAGSRRHHLQHTRFPKAVEAGNSSLSDKDSMVVRASSSDATSMAGGGTPKWSVAC